MKNISRLLCTFCCTFIVLSVCAIYLKFCCIFPESFPCLQIKLKLLSIEIASALENKELLGRFRVYRKSATSAKMDGRISVKTVTRW